MNSRSDSHSQDTKTLVEDSDNHCQNRCSQYTWKAIHFFNRSVLPRVFSVAEMQFPNESFIEGDLFWGKASELFSDDGRGVDRILIEQAAPVAKKNIGGIAHWRFGPTRIAVLLTKPDDIKSTILENKQNIYFHDTTGSFKLFFGPNTIFNAPYQSPDWVHSRTRFLKTLFSATSLQKNVATMQDISNKFITTIVKNNYSIDNLEQFANSITMDMIGQTKLGLKHIDESVKEKISAIIASATIAIANPTNQIINEYLPFVKYFYKSHLQTLLDEGFTVLREEVIKPNADNILSTSNWLNEDGNKADLDLYSKNIVYEITQFLVAGHETTAKLLLMSLLLLGDSSHKDILDKVHQEISAKNSAPQEWQHEDFENMPYLNAVLNEVLRLYPPIPDMVFKVANPFPIAAGHVKQDDLIIISPRITHRLQSIWGDDADQFRPERFLEKKFNDYEHFPFGFMPRQCVGRNFSMQEVKLALSRLIYLFDLKHDLHHPFPHHQIFTLRIDLEKIHMKFSLRNSLKEQESNTHEAAQNHAQSAALLTEEDLKPSFRL